MQLDRDKSSGIVIRSFSAGELRVNDQVIHDPVMLTADEIITSWSPPDFSAISITDFRLALDRDPEVILFGTGPVQRFPPTTLMTAVMRGGIGFEVMDTAAACRTFNVLAGESRRVIAALLLDGT